MHRGATLAACAAAVAVWGAGCGGGDEPRGAQSTSRPLARAPSATAPPAGAAPSTVTAPAPRDRRDMAAPGGATAVRVPATFTLRGAKLSPQVVAIPAFLAVRVSVAATDRRAHLVTITADRTYRLRVPAGKRASVLLPGQRAGRYPVRSGSARAALEVGGEPGP